MGTKELKKKKEKNKVNIRVDDTYIDKDLAPKGDFLHLDKQECTVLRKKKDSVTQPISSESDNGLDSEESDDQEEDHLTTPTIVPNIELRREIHTEVSQTSILDNEIGDDFPEEDEKEVEENVTKHATLPHKKTANTTNDVEELKKMEKWWKELSNKEKKLEIWKQEKAICKYLVEEFKQDVVNKEKDIKEAEQVVKTCEQFVKATQQSVDKVIRRLKHNQQFLKGIEQTVDFSKQLKINQSVIKRNQHILTLTQRAIKNCQTCLKNCQQRVKLYQGLLKTNQQLPKLYEQMLIFSQSGNKQQKIMVSMYEKSIRQLKKGEKTASLQQRLNLLNFDIWYYKEKIKLNQQVIKSDQQKIKFFQQLVILDQQFKKEALEGFRVNKQVIELNEQLVNNQEAKRHNQLLKKENDSFSEKTLLLNIKEHEQAAKNIGKSVREGNQGIKRDQAIISMCEKSIKQLTKGKQIPFLIHRIREGQPIVRQAKEIVDYIALQPKTDKWDLDYWAKRRQEVQGPLQYVKILSLPVQQAQRSVLRSWRGKNKYSNGKHYFLPESVLSKITTEFGTAIPSDNLEFATTDGKAMEEEKEINIPNPSTRLLTGTPAPLRRQKRTDAEIAARRRNRQAQRRTTSKSKTTKNQTWTEYFGWK